MSILKQVLLLIFAFTAAQTNDYFNHNKSVFYNPVLLDENENNIGISIAREAQEVMNKLELIEMKSKNLPKEIEIDTSEFGFAVKYFDLLLEDGYFDFQGELYGNTKDLGKSELASSLVRGKRFKRSQDLYFDLAVGSSCFQDIPLGKNHEGLSNGVGLTLKQFISWSISDIYKIEQSLTFSHGLYGDKFDSDSYKLNNDLTFSAELLKTFNSKLSFAINLIADYDKRSNYDTNEEVRLIGMLKLTK